MTPLSVFLFVEDFVNFLTIFIHVFPLCIFLSVFLLYNVKMGSPMYYPGVFL